MTRSSGARACGLGEGIPLGSSAFTRRRVVLALRSAFLMGATFLTGLRSAGADDRDEKPDPVAFWAALQDARATLEAGLLAGQKRGRPVSARFTMQTGDLHLIVCTATGDGFLRLMLDPNTAVVLDSEPIKASDELADATSQKAAMEEARVSLLAAVQQALRDNKGARAVEVAPKLQGGRPIAVVTLLNGSRLLMVSKWLEGRP